MYPFIPSDAVIHMTPETSCVLDDVNVALTNLEAQRLSVLSPHLKGLFSFDEVAVEPGDEALILKLQAGGVVFDLPLNADSAATSQFCDYLCARVRGWRMSKRREDWPWREVISSGKATEEYLKGIIAMVSLRPMAISTTNKFFKDQQIDKSQHLDQLRDAYPVFRVEGVRAVVGSTVSLEFEFSAADVKFRPVVKLHGLLPEETQRLETETARRLIRALSIVEAFSYWKAFCSPIIEVKPPLWDADEISWWRSFWPNAMGEFFYRNGINFTDPGFLDIRMASDRKAVASKAPAPVSCVSNSEPQAPFLIMFSGGKDSLALALGLGRNGERPIDCFLYNPTPAQTHLAESLLAGGRILRVERVILPELLALNTAGHPNGHTPYSAYLALAAMLLGYLRGNEFVFAGNSRSDDEPNIDSYFGHPVNHQWTKTYEFEEALREYRNRWLPSAPIYSSPFRPLLELQLVASLSKNIDLYLQTASCNRTKSNGWCRKCAKCAWVFLATSALFGLDLAVQKMGTNLFKERGLAELYERMAGLTGTKPFECTGTAEEVRVAIRHVGLRDNQKDVPALVSCLSNPVVIGVRTLDSLIADDWGRDDLVPDAVIAQIREMAHQ
jgi:UDP-N-acetyl-alpha-D-muramoyl-L-alanyl-L-glutamate epimerase